MRCLPCLFVFFVLPPFLYSQSDFIASVYPPQHALTATQDTRISVTFSVPIDPVSLNDTTVAVYGRQSGLHRGAIGYDPMTQLLTWIPERDFAIGEVVTVILTRHIQPQGTGEFNGFIWQFWIKVTNPTDAHFTLAETLDWPEKNDGMALADLNNDQFLDLILIGDVFGTLSVWFNDGTGNFEINGFYPVLEHFRSQLVVGDFDRDYDLDLATPIRFGLSSDPDPLLFYWNDGQGFLPDTTRMLTLAGALAASRIPNDLDADGDIDLILSDLNADFAFVYKNLDNRAFQLQGQYSTGFFSAFPLLADVDLDGDLDMVTSVFGQAGPNENVKLLFNNGRGIFNSIVVVDSIILARHLVDFDGDTDLDLIVQEATSDSINIYFNNGKGRFVLAGKYRTGRENLSYCVSDFDGDGDLDIATTGERLLNAMPVVYQGFLRLLLNDGNGCFTLFSEDTIGTRVKYMDCGDIDNDGDIDIIIAEYSRVSYILFNDNKTTSIDDIQRERIPSDFLVLGNYPNPFNSETTIRYSLPQTTQVDIKVYNISGKEVITLFKGNKLPGFHTVKWSGIDQTGTEVSSGVYFVVMKSLKGTQAGKILLLK